MNYGKNGLKKKQKSLNSKGIKIRKMMSITFLKAAIICALSGVVIVCSLGIGMFNGMLEAAPDINTIDVTPTGYATNIYDSEGHLMTKLVAANSNRTYVSMDKIPQNLAHAFVAIEDERFYEHNGIDIKGIVRAAYEAVKSKGLNQGASTITQQLIKNNVFENWKTEEGTVEKVKRKIQEQYLAQELEKNISKSQILEYYMNTINLGQNTLGVQEASLRYFNKPVYELTLSECAVIAGITQNPSKLNPISHPDNNSERRDKILNNMLEQGYITQSEYDEAKADNVYERIQTVNTVAAETNQVFSYFVDEVIETAAKDIANKLIEQGYTETQAQQKAMQLLYSGGLSIYTTQDPQIQSICDEVIGDESNYPDNVKWLLSYQLTIEKADGTKENHSTEKFKTYYKQFNSKFDLLYSSQEAAYEAIAAYEEAVMEPGDEIIGENITLTPQPQISITIEDQATGQVVALVGGRGVKETSRSLNRATNTPRQPGSCFKVLAAYAPALDACGYTLASVYNDAPFNYSNGRPVHNWYGSAYKGICSYRYGIEQSLNIITVKVITAITPELGFDYLEKFGFTSLVERRIEADGRVRTDVTQALALGGITDGVYNLELNAAYAAIANEGVYNEPILYTKIVNHDGSVLIDKTADQVSRRVLRDANAYLLTSAMQDVVTKGTGSAANFSGQTVAGKTGTTSNNYDVWFAGYTPYYTCTTWVGYDNNVTMNSAEKNVVKSIWKKVMSRVHEGLESKEFQQPADIVKCTVCSKSGLLPIQGLCDGHLKTEIFAEGTTPTEHCNVHYAGMICASTLKCASPNCPFKIPGALQLPVVEDFSDKGKGKNKNRNNNQSSQKNMCPHTDMFFTDPNYRAVLQAELENLRAAGYDFSLEGY